MGSRVECACGQLVHSKETQDQVGEGGSRTEEPTSSDLVVRGRAVPSGAGGGAAAASETPGEGAAQLPEETGRQKEAAPVEDTLLLMLEVQEVVEVVTQGQEELPREEVSMRQNGLWAETARGSSMLHWALEELQLLQSHICSVSEQASRTYELLRRNVAERLRSHLARRQIVIQGIPGFWATAVSLPAFADREGKVERLRGKQYLGAILSSD